MLPGLRRDDLLSNPWLMPDDGTGTWWRLTAAPAPVPDPDPVDVLIVGAGPVGLALALQAHAHGAHVRVMRDAGVRFFVPHGR